MAMRVLVMFNGAVVGEELKLEKAELADFIEAELELGRTVVIESET